MSIIQDALKKAEKRGQSRGNISVGYAQARNEAPDEIVTVKSGGRIKARYIAYAITLLLLASIFEASHFFSSGSGKTFAPAPSKIKVEPIRPVQPIAQLPKEGIPAIKAPAINVPSAPLLPKEPPADEFKLSGIMYPAEGPRAIINNMRVAEGDDIDGAKVISINDDTVLLKKQDAEIKLRLK